MNRRTVLQSVGVTAVVSLSGCLEALQEHYQGSFRGLVPVELYNEADQHYDLRLEAYAASGGRQTYKESYTITSDQRATAPHLDATKQHFRATKFGREGERLAVKEGMITSNTSRVVVRITNDGLILNIERGNGEETGPTAGPEPSDTETGGIGQNDTDADGTEPNGTESNDGA
ncbi:hypothetical protein [Natrinema sp. 74]|uniref:hypothetical protein n=1 Tax=Natrinema sp. 74 TaxID=3384159 RepID=UPI0038D41020